MNKSITYLIIFLIVLAFLAFSYGIIKACQISWQFPVDGSDYEYKIPAFLTLTITSIATVFSTNLGAVLGITINDPGSIFRLSKTWNPFKAISNPSLPAIQIIACYLYILALIAAAIVWGRRDFTEVSNEIVPVIPELTRSLLGVVVGVLAISLNTTVQSKN